MVRNMKAWRTDLLNGVKREAIPLLSYLGTRITGNSVLDAVQDGFCQFASAKAAYSQYPSAAAVTCVDLSVEAEAFGCLIDFRVAEPPSILNGIIENMEGIRSLEIPTLMQGRILERLYAVHSLSLGMQNLPILATMTGPFTLAGRLFDRRVSTCSILKQPQNACELLDRCTQYLCSYAQAFKSVGANGLIVFEPAAGQLFADRYEELSAAYVKKIVDAVQDDSFLVILSDGSAALERVKPMLRTGCKGYHFSSAVDMASALPLVPADVLAFGSVAPCVLRHGTPEDVVKSVRALLAAAQDYPNFVLSTGVVNADTPVGNLQALYTELDSVNRPIEIDAIA